MGRTGYGGSGCIDDPDGGQREPWAVGVGWFA